MSWDTNNITDRVEWADVNGMYFRSTGKDHGEIWALGNTSMRTASTSSTGFNVTTPVMSNGAGLMTFFVRNWDITKDQSPVVVLKSVNGTEWIEVGRVVPNTAEWESWKEVSVNINDNSPTLQVRVEFEKTIIELGQIYIDDLEILPWSVSTSMRSKEYSNEVFASKGEIIFNTSVSQPYEIYNLAGHLVRVGSTESGLCTGFEKGIYLVKLKNYTYKIIL